MKENQPSSLIPPLIYQDRDLLLINKPAGLLSVPDGYNPDLPHLRSVLEPIYGPLWIVHRLDRETSGVVVLAKNKISHRELNGFFRNREIHKVYHGLVTPSPTFNTKNIELPLKPNADREHRTRVDYRNGKPAQSIIQVVKRFDLGALLEIRILTGITHQIRAHLRQEELTFFGDTLYNAGLPSQPLTAPRTMLHARQIGFTHPNSREEMQFIANYPEDFRGFYTKLRFTKALDEAI
jgi:RluA family pseudouridine synthase